MQKYIRGLFFLLLITFITNIVPVQAALVDEKAAPVEKATEPAPAGPTDEELLSKIDQLLIVGFRGTELNKDNPFTKVLSETNLGGVILFDYDSETQTAGRNITSPLQLRKLNEELQLKAKTPLVISIDEEGGSVNRLKKKLGFSYVIPKAKDLGLKKPSNTLFGAKRLARQMKALGINLDFAPVADLDFGSKSSIIGAFGRAFSSKPFAVIAHARAFMQGLDFYGVGSVLKHFPGHGSARGDTHQGLVDVTETYDKAELEPFAKLIDDGSAKAIMVGHLVNKKIDPDFPASLSEKTIEGILKGDLGFTGVVMTDDLNMGAISDLYSPGEAAVAALSAGNDLLIFSNNIDTYDDNLVFDVREAILKAVHDKTLSVETITNAYERVTYWKRWLNILPDEEPILADE